MFLKLLRKSLGLLIVLFILNGCIAQDLKPEFVSKVKRVGIVSMLPTKLKYEKIGITVFNNEVLIRDVGDQFNNVAIDSIKNEVLSVQKDRSVLIMPITKSILEKYYSHSLVVSSPTERIQTELSSWILKENLDAVFVVAEIFDSDQYRRGLEVYFRAGFGTINSATLKPNVVILVIGKDGKVEAATASPVQGQSIQTISGGEWGYELEKSITDSENDRLIQEMKSLIKSDIYNMIAKLKFN